jgi:putative transposase
MPGLLIRQSKFTETHIVSILKAVGAEWPVNEIRRKYGINSAIYLYVESQVGRVEASDIDRLKVLQHENSKSKRLYVDMALENAALNDSIEKTQGPSNAEKP